MSVLENLIFAHGQNTWMQLSPDALKQVERDLPVVNEGRALLHKPPLELLAGYGAHRIATADEPEPPAPAWMGGPNPAAKKG